ncbi:hypothetical protein NEAUS05_2638, partial [Nematocida ausubeli]
LFLSSSPAFLLLSSSPVSSCLFPSLLSQTLLCLFSPALSPPRVYSSAHSLCALSPVLFTAPLACLSLSLLLSLFCFLSFFLKLFTFLFLFCFLDTFFPHGCFIFPLFPRLCLLALHTLSFAGPLSLCPSARSPPAPSGALSGPLPAPLCAPPRSASFLPVSFWRESCPVTNYNRYRLNTT